VCVVGPFTHYYGSSLAQAANELTGLTGCGGREAEAKHLVNGGGYLQLMALNAPHWPSLKITGGYAYLFMTNPPVPIWNLRNYF
jgi:hypothetical protein